MSLMALPPLALPSSGSCGRRLSFEGALSARHRAVARELPPTADVTRAAQRSLVAPWRGEEVRQDPVDLGVEGEPDVAAVDLDRIDVGAEARLPVHDPVGARVDRGRG